MIISPNDSRIINNLAIVKFEYDLIDEALELWKKILLLNPDRSDIYYLLFSAYAKKKQYDSAAKYAHIAVEKGMDISPEILQELQKYRK
jgi:tetratricopeptide (TPR) repeat protein